MDGQEGGNLSFPLSPQCMIIILLQINLPLLVCSGKKEDPRGKDQNGTLGSRVCALPSRSSSWAPDRE